jgi:hypothetical protein
VSPSVGSFTSQVWLVRLLSLTHSSFSRVRIGALEIYFAFPAGNRTCQWRESPSCSISNEWEEACISLSPIETGPEPSTKISLSSSVTTITPQASIPASSQSQCHPLCQDKNQSHSAKSLSSNLRVIVQRGHHAKSGEETSLPSFPCLV